MTFAVGDGVRILAHLVPGTGISIPPGTIAIIEKVADEDKDYFRLSYDGDRSWYFASEHFEPEITNHPMLTPEFDLEDMELAEIIMEEMK